MEKTFYGRRGKSWIEIMVWKNDYNLAKSKAKRGVCVKMRVQEDSLRGGNMSWLGMDGDSMRGARNLD